MAGRIESYLHSDGMTENKGGALVCVCCDTDFGAKTPEFTEFAKFAAKRVYGFQVKKWNVLVALHPEAEERRKACEAAIGEKVTVCDISLMGLPKEAACMCDGGDCK